MDEVLIRNALNSMLEATEDDATPIIRRLARVQARAALDTLASAPAGDGVEATVVTISVKADGSTSFHSSIPPGQGWDATCSAMEVAMREFQRQFEESGKCPAKPAALARPRAAVVEQLPADVAELVNRIGRAEWGATDALDADEHGKHVADSVRITAANFDQTEPQRMQGLYVEGTETVICHVGTSPNSPAVARALAGAWNHLCDLAALQSPPAKVEG